jgi:hypothetical protein
MKAEEMEAKLKSLESSVKILQDIEDINKLQRAYGYYLEHWMSQELVDLFSDSPDAVVDIYRGKWYGKEGIARLFNTYLGPDTHSPEFLHMVMQLSGIVDIEPDGKTAKGRWYGFGMVAMPVGGGIRQHFMAGIYECVYAKENGKWKIKMLQFNRTLSFPPGQGWVQPERIAAIDPKKIRTIVPDGQRTVEPGYPAGYIPPFHFKHPVTGKETTEKKRNAAAKAVK